MSFRSGGIRMLSLIGIMLAFSNQTVKASNDIGKDLWRHSNRGRGGWNRGGKNKKPFKGYEKYFRAKKRAFNQARNKHHRKLRHK